MKKAYTIEKSTFELTAREFGLKYLPEYIEDDEMERVIYSRDSYGRTLLKTFENVKEAYSYFNGISANHAVIRSCSAFRFIDSELYELFEYDVDDDGELMNPEILESVCSTFPAREWYALQSYRGDSDWSTGTYDKTEAFCMLDDWKEKYGDEAHIAVILNNECIEEIYEE